MSEREGGGERERVGVGEYKIMKVLNQSVNLTLANDSRVHATAETTSVLTVCTVEQIGLIATTRHAVHYIWVHAYLRLMEMHTTITVTATRGTCAEGYKSFRRKLFCRCE